MIVKRVKDIVNICIYQSCYLSVWSLCAVYMFCYYPSSRTFSMVYPLVSLCSVGGLYLTYIHPRQLYLPHMRFHCDHSSLIVVDLLSHHLPLFVILNQMVKYNYVPCLKTVTQDYILTSIVLYMYYHTVDWYSRYHVTGRDLCFIAGLWVLMSTCPTIVFQIIHT